MKKSLVRMPFLFIILLSITGFIPTAGCSVVTKHEYNSAEIQNTKKRASKRSKKSEKDLQLAVNDAAAEAGEEDLLKPVVPRPLEKKDLPQAKFTKDDLQKACLKGLGKFPGKYNKALLKDVCADVEIFDSCVSVKGQPIYHYDRPSKRKGAERILTFAVTHGDEVASGSVARSWVNRLSKISPRNAWRVVPVVNPDGYDKRTRTNGAGVDINRNYPSKDWDKYALDWWKKKKKSDPRRYPGPSAASEPETVCTMDHIKEFKPDLIISVHTPLGLLDFDGPPMKFPRFTNLPWNSLGTYPGSLGRYMWDDNEVPVMTIELKHNIKHALDQFDRLQDISGQVALMIAKREKEKSKRN